jgi:cyclase
MPEIIALEKLVILEEADMKCRIAVVSIVAGAALFAVTSARAQDLGPHVKTIRDGIYVYTGQPQDSNVTIIRTQEGVVLIDTGQSPADSKTAMDAVKKLTPQPVRFVIHTEPHGDHTVGDFVFSPPAAVIAAKGAGDSMRQANAAANPAGPKVFPHIEYENKMMLNVGERKFELFYLKNVHSEADTAIWLPQERIIFAAAAVGVKRYPNIRPSVTIPDILAAIKTMRALNPEVVIPGHGEPGTTKIFDDMERYYSLLLERVGKMASAGRTLEQIKTELRMPEYDDWDAKDRFPTNVDAAWRAVKKN